MAEMKGKSVVDDDEGENVVGDVEVGLPVHYCTDQTEKKESHAGIEAVIVVDVVDVQEVVSYLDEVVFETVRQAEEIDVVFVDCAVFSGFAFSFDLVDVVDVVRVGWVDNSAQTID